MNVYVVKAGHNAIETTILALLKLCLANVTNKAIISMPILENSEPRKAMVPSAVGTVRILLVM